MRALLFSFTFLTLSCCSWANTSDAAVRSALNVLTDVVAPTSKLAKEGCDAREALPLAQVIAGKITTAQADAEGAEIRGRCDTVRAAFDTIRSLHEEAAKFVEEGNLEDARRRIEAARAQFRGLMSQLEAVP